MKKEKTTTFTAAGHLKSDAVQMSSNNLDFLFGLTDAEISKVDNQAQAVAQAAIDAAHAAKQAAMLY